MKNNAFRILIVLLGLSFIFSSCWFIPGIRGNGIVKEQSRSVNDFDQIEVSRGMNVYLTQGNEVQLTVVADENLHQIIKTKVVGKVLKIYAEKNISWATEKKVLVTVEQLTDLETSSGSNVWSQNRLKVDEIEISSSSGSNITIDLDAKSIEAHCSSGSNMHLSGIATKALLKSSSGANLLCPDLMAEQCEMRASSGSRVSSGVSGKLNASASSGGNIVYYGNPAITEFSTSSGGSINKN
jgi:hypothetical protein